MKILRILLLPCAALAAAEAEAPKEVTEFREAAHRILRVAPAISGDKAMDAKILELRARLTPLPQGSERPMSEQSRPLLTLQNVALAPGKPALEGSACAVVVRMSAVNPERLASYTVKLAKSGETWKLTSIEAGCAGTAGAEPLLGVVILPVQ